MNKKKWLVVGIAIVLLVVSGISQIGLTYDGSEDKESAFESWNPYALLLGNQEMMAEVIEPGDPSQRILVLPIEGQIGLEGTGYNHELLLSAVEQAEQDESIQAIMLDIDTPGGAVYHTHELYTALVDLKESADIPIYASMGSTAASGGYYLSVAADHIYAGPETLTGSIGVILSNFDVSGFMENHGIEQNVIKSGDMKDILSATREMTDEEMEVLQSYIDESFDSFIAAIDQGRDNLSEDEIRDLADGRIYSGRQAAEAGLIDDVGYFKEALDHLRETEGLEDAEVFQFVVDEPFSLFPGFPFAKNKDSDTNLPSLIQHVEDAQRMSIDYRWEGAPAYGR